MKVWKQILAPDVYYWTRKGWFRPTRADIQAYHDNSKRMIAAGVPAPVPLEHQAGAVPMSAAEAKKALVGLNTGFVTDYRINADGVLESQLDIDWIPDGNGQPIRDEAEIRARLEKSIRYVSPNLIGDFTAGDGTNYGPVVGHVALTPIPVWHGQAPFGEAGGSLPMSRHFAPAELTTQKTDISLSLASAFVQDASARWFPFSSISLSGAAAMPVPPENKEKEGEKAEEVAAAKTQEEEAGEPPVEKPAEDASGDSAVIERVIECLAKDNLIVPPAKTAKEMLEHICTAVATKLAHEKGGEMDDDEPPANQEGSMPPAPEPQMTALSRENGELKAANKKLRAEQKAQADRIAKLEKSNSVSLSSLAERESADLTAVVDVLEREKFCTPDEAKAWKSHLTSHALSLVDDDAKERAETQRIKLLIEDRKTQLDRQVAAGRVKRLTTDIVELSRSAVAVPGKEGVWGPDPAKEQKAAEDAGDAMARKFRNTKTEDAAKSTRTRH